MTHYRSFHAAMADRFGCKVYKLALDGGMTCPNRDGTLGDRGCVFCGETGSGAFAQPVCGSVLDQLEAAKARVAGKNRGGKYIAYFQSFTNTYAPVAYLEDLFTKALDPEDICALAVATRPDCLPQETVDLLARLARRKPVWVELGLQTIRPETAQYIRRGWELPVYDDAVRRLHAAGVEVVVHVILGLPGENRQDMLDTVRYVGESGAEGIKLQLLHVLDGTDLARDWRAGNVPVFSRADYIDLLEDCLAELPPQMVIHRLTGDGAKRDLLAPLWSGDKKGVLNAIRAAFDRDEVRQGSRWRERKETICRDIPDRTNTTGGDRT